MTATRGQRDLTCGRQVVMLSSGCHSCLEGCGLSRETSDVDRWRSLILQHRGGRLQRTAPLGAPAGALALHAAACIMWYLSSPPCWIACWLCLHPTRPTSST